MLEAGDALDCPPRTTVLGTVFSPVFNYYSPTNRTGETFPSTPEVHDSPGRENCTCSHLFISLHPSLFCLYDFIDPTC